MTRDERELAEAEGYLKGRGATRKRLCTQLQIHESLLSKIFKGVHAPSVIFWIQCGEALRDMQNIVNPPRFDKLAHS